MGKTRDFADIFGFYKVLHSPTCKGSGARGEGMALVNVLRRWDFTYHCFMDGDNVSMGLLFIVMDVSPPLWESSCPIYWTCFFVDCLPRSSTSCSRCDCRRKFICGSRVLNQRCGVIQSSRDVGQVCAKGKHFFG